MQRSGLEQSAFLPPAVPGVLAASISGCGFCHKAETSFQTGGRRGHFAPRLGSASKDERRQGYFVANSWSRPCVPGPRCGTCDPSELAGFSALPGTLVRSSRTARREASALYPISAPRLALPCKVQHLTSAPYPYITSQRAEVNFFLNLTYDIRPLLPCRRDLFLSSISP